jgi:predicted nucleic acid-binding protein
LILVDTNVILDVVQDDPLWAEWSQGQLDTWAVRDELAINAVIYAELSIAYARIEELEDTIDTAELRLLEMPREALFLASKAFLAYRKRGGTRTGVLPDFFIGAHAAVLELPLLTRETARYRTYFPGVALITPEV